MCPHHSRVKPKQHRPLQDGQTDVVRDDDAAKASQRFVDGFLQHGRLGESAHQEEETHAAHLGFRHQLFCNSVVKKKKKDV